jgi:hypothetical protein
LLFRQRQAHKEAEGLDPFGFGRSRYFYSFVVALVPVLFTLDSVFALYEDYQFLGSVWSLVVGGVL